MNRQNRLFTIVLIVSLAACNLPGYQASPTATSINVPTNTPGEPPATETVAAPEPSTTPTQEGGPVLEAILITSPGSTSIVTSPVSVEGQSRPTFEQGLVVAIYGEDGTLLAQQPTTILADAGSPGPFSTSLTFSVDQEQAGRISVFETSAMDGGILHLASVEVTLRPSGSANIVPATIGLEAIDIQSPTANGQISGGSITVSGISDYYFESTLGLRLCGQGDGGGVPDDLCGDSHSVLGSGTAMIASTEMGQPGPFSGDLTWSVSEPTPGRIIVYAASPRDGGWIHIASIPVLILP